MYIRQNLVRVRNIYLKTYILLRLEKFACNVHFFNAFLHGILCCLFRSEFFKAYMRAFVLCPFARRGKSERRNNNANNCEKGEKVEENRVHERNIHIRTKTARNNGGEVARSYEGEGKEREGEGERKQAGVFAIIIIADFLPLMLRQQQVAALAHVALGQIVRDNDESQSKSSD